MREKCPQLELAAYENGSHKQSLERCRKYNVDGLLRELRHASGVLKCNWTWMMTKQTLNYGTVIYTVNHCDERQCEID